MAPQGSSSREICPDPVGTENEPLRWGGLNSSPAQQLPLLLSPLNPNTQHWSNVVPTPRFPSPKLAILALRLVYIPSPPSFASVLCPTGSRSHRKAFTTIDLTKGSGPPAPSTISDFVPLESKGVNEAFLPRVKSGAGSKATVDFFWGGMSLHLRRAAVLSPDRLQT